MVPRGIRLSLVPMLPARTIPCVTAVPCRRRRRVATGAEGQRIHPGERPALYRARKTHGPNRELPHIFQRRRLPGIGRPDRSDLILQHLWLLVLRLHEPTRQPPFLILLSTTQLSIATAAGLAHMLEHEAFKGSSRIGTSDWNRERPLLEAQDEGCYLACCSTVCVSKAAACFARLVTHRRGCSVLHAEGGPEEKHAAACEAPGREAGSSSKGGQQLHDT